MLCLASQNGDLASHDSGKPPGQRQQCVSRKSVMARKTARLFSSQCLERIDPRRGSRREVGRECCHACKKTRSRSQRARIGRSDTKQEAGG